MRYNKQAYVWSRGGHSVWPKISVSAFGLYFNAKISGPTNSVSVSVLTQIQQHFHIRKEAMEIFNTKIKKNVSTYE
jgi:hypothetical protein